MSIDDALSLKAAQDRLRGLPIKTKSVTIAKQFDFDAAHWLPGVPEWHKCHRMHGHTYRCDLVFRGDLDERGFVLDFEEISGIWSAIHAAIDHRTLNDVPGLENPTCEVLAGWIAKRADHPNLIAVRVWESSTTWAEVEI